MKLFIYFHLNLAYSSIEEEERLTVIERCYWPLLRLIEKYKIPVGLEASAYTLGEINRLDPAFIKKLKILIKNNDCDFIGSGFSQIIGPLVPWEINDFNLKIANKIYYELLRIRPKIALINEQTISSGILDAYLKNGYKSIIMDWDNIFQSNKNLKTKHSFYSQKFITANNKRINTIWSSSIAFQKFQNFVHGDLEMSAYLDFLEYSVKNQKKGAFCIYASDLEVINFRTKRYTSESKINNDEWKKIESLFKKLLKKYRFIKPSEVIKIKKNKSNSVVIDLNNPANPCPTKKQPKYNIVRWAVTGRNDEKINTICWKIFFHLKTKKIKNVKLWKELCYLWSSDFRTHITEKRWNKFNKRIFNLKLKLSIDSNQKEKFSIKKDSSVQIEKKNNRLKIEGKNISVIFNLNKGCSIDKFYDKRIDGQHLFGTIPRGYYKSIEHSADYYSGHLVIEPFGRQKITDLEKSKIKIINWENGLIISLCFKNYLGTIEKKWFFDDKNNRIGLYYKIKTNACFDGSIRLNYITLNPKVFNQDKILHFMTHNGGNKIEKFLINNITNFDHGQFLSHLVSANSAVGITNQILKIGKDEKNITINIDRNYSSQIGMLSYKKINKNNFYRSYFSVKEHDETSKMNKKLNIETKIWVKAN
tara:strand:- start:7890 stop:9827 length:1938 start_codon:yes stop_codon:yes gene_type:complete